jgi:hypothetical protein
VKGIKQRKTLKSRIKEFLPRQKAERILEVLLNETQFSELISTAYRNDLTHYKKVELI